MNGAWAGDMIAVARALGDENRARIVGLLGVRALCVCELMAALSLSQATVSDHVRILVDAGLLSASRRSYWTVYSIRQGLPSDVRQFLARLIEQVRVFFPNDRTHVTDTPVFLCRANSTDKKLGAGPRALRRRPGST